MEKVTESVAQFVYEAALGTIPVAVIERAKVHILDTIGTLCAGSKESIATIVRQYIASMGCRDESTFITQAMKTSPQSAAFGNAILAHVLDFDDYEWPSMAHPSTVVLPAVLALGEKIGADGKACLEAYLVGIEVISKVGRGINPNHYDKGWHSTGTLGVLGAAAACTKLLRADLDAIKTALGIAASMASGLRGNFGTMTKPFHAGHASRAGVEAAILASFGFTADQTILEHELGYCAIFTEGGGYDLIKIVESLGKPFSIVSPGLGMKPYPSCAATHSVLDGALELARRDNIAAENVDRVECGIFYLYPKMLIHSSPETALEGKFSLEFCVALALADREVTLSSFTDEKVNQPAIKQLVKKVKKYVTDEVGGRGTLYPGAIVKIDLKDGTTCSIRVDARKGSPSNPLSQNEIIDKFQANASLALNGARIGEILEKVMRLEKLERIDGLITSLNQD